MGVLHVCVTVWMSPGLEELGRGCSGELVS